MDEIVFQRVIKDTFFTLRAQGEDLYMEVVAPNILRQKDESAGKPTIFRTAPSPNTWGVPISHLLSEQKYTLWRNWVYSPLWISESGEEIKGVDNLIERARLPTYDEPLLWRGEYYLAISGTHMIDTSDMTEGVKVKQRCVFISAACIVDITFSPRYSPPARLLGDRAILVLEMLKYWIKERQMSKNSTVYQSMRAFERSLSAAT